MRARTPRAQGVHRHTRGGNQAPAIHGAHVLQVMILYHRPARLEDRNAQVAWALLTVCGNRRTVGTVLRDVHEKKWPP